MKLTWVLKLTADICIFFCEVKFIGKHLSFQEKKKIKYLVIIFSYGVIFPENV